MATTATSKDHAILLIQYGEDLSSRTYLDYDSVALCADGACPCAAVAPPPRRPPNSAASPVWAEPPSALASGICALYEKGLKALNPNTRHITYDIADLYHYIDQLTDMTCLV
eukprot:6777602-Prymnesium_polylepis.1